MGRIFGSANRRIGKIAGRALCSPTCKRTGRHQHGGIAAFSRHAASHEIECSSGGHHLEGIVGDPTRVRQAGELLNTFFSLHGPGRTRPGKRMGKAALEKGGINAFELFEQAMDWFEKAEAIRPAGNDDAILRWNGCARIIKRNNLAPREVSANDFIE